VDWWSNGSQLSPLACVDLRKIPLGSSPVYGDFCSLERGWSGGGWMAC